MEPKLSRDTLVDGALGLLDAEGMEALTIRRLAQSLGYTPMAVYWHVKNKDELLLAVSERLWSLAAVDNDPDLEPLDQLRSMFASMLSALRAHPQATPLLTRTGAGYNKACFDVTEATLEIFHRLGFPPDQAAHLSIQALWTLISLVGSEPGAPQPGLSAEEQAEKERGRRATLLSLDPARYPHTIAAAPALTNCEQSEAFYRLGVEVFLAGVARLAESQPASGR
ncbi:TetR/AcrR family transcriptional regulator [Streptacidiphilus sp. P02-A3a]|uniref:TetR/AcrR family transcriptional regulator n=1 Tax=Streptacidiphilus sp. P02-A3a TaxID=2704468 RepID=UPI001CDCC64A|nr:TetR family transcriptional regulator [Streptacidiphilus sp. P02-A3a]